jgi:hypothetical protein
MSLSMGGKPRRLVLFSALGALAFTGEAWAESVEALSVERGLGAEECPDAVTLSQRIAAIRGRASAASGARYDIGFARTGNSFTATIRSGPNGESQRVLEGLNCTALAQATAVTLALLFDSEADDAGNEVPKAPPVPARPPPKRERPLADLVLVPVREHRPTAVEGTLSLGAAGLIGVLRPLSPAVTGELGLQVARWRMGLGVLWNPKQTLVLAPGVVRESLQSGSARGCLALARTGASRFDFCAGLFVGVASAEAEGFTTAQRRTRPWLAIPLELSFSERAGSIGWEVSAAALGSLVHQDFSIDHLGPAYQSPRVAAMLSLRAVGLLSL